MYRRDHMSMGVARVRNNAKTIIASTVASVAAIGLMAAPAFAAVTVTNGSFETGTPTGPYTPVLVGGATIPGWNVTAGSVDYITTYWTASDGAASVDLNGWEPGTLSQTFSTVAGHAYTVTFDLAGNPDGGYAGSPAVKTLTVGTGSTTTPYSFDTTGHSDASMGWQKQTYKFTATSASTTLAFTSTTTGGASPWFGPALDNVQVSLDTPIHKSQCKNNGWKDYTNPSFKNQGKCIDWVHARATGDLKLAGPSQRIIFNVSNHQGPGKHHHRNTVEYWNYDYPGGLHYKADVTCAYVNPLTNEARFTFQIPAGHAGLSGLYVLAYVKEVKGHNTPDLYGHTATTSADVATQWCQTGVGASPTMYTVTKGHVEVE